MTLGYVPQAWVTMSKYIIIRMRNMAAVARGWRSSPASGGGDAAPGRCSQWVKWLLHAAGMAQRSNQTTLTLVKQVTFLQAPGDAVFSSKSLAELRSQQ